MADFAMTYESLQNASNQINKAESDLSTVIQSLNNAVTALDGEWVGQSYTAFRNAWENSKPTLNKLQEALAQFAPELQEAVRSQMEREQTTAAKMDNLAF